MPPERNTRSIVEVPEVFVCGVLQASERPTLAGSAAFSRSMLSNSSRLSSGARPGPPRNGLTWACAAADKRTKAASAADKQRDDRRRIDLSSLRAHIHTSAESAAFVIHLGGSEIEHKSALYLPWRAFSQCRRVPTSR